MNIAYEDDKGFPTLAKAEQKKVFSVFEDEILPQNKKVH
jgi:hypothetical protein